jgi:hypothetical protein
MKTNYLITLIVVIFALTACNKDDNKGMTDEQLIEAIQNATDKSNIDFTELPSSSQTVINNDYSDLSVELAMLAPELGYQVNMLDDYNFKDMVRTYAFFDLSGRQLVAKGNDYKSDNTGYKSCFTFIYPITFVLGDNIITINSDEELRIAQARWKELDRRPILQFPADIIMGDRQLTLENEQQLIRVKAACDETKNNCFNLVFPVTYVAGDNIVTISNNEQLRSAYQRWKEAGIRAFLQYPVNIIWYEGTTQTINNEDEMKAAKDRCDNL